MINAKLNEQLKVCDEVVNGFVQLDERCSKIIERISKANLAIKAHIILGIILIAAELILKSVIKDDSVTELIATIFFIPIIYLLAVSPIIWVVKRIIYSVKKKSIHHKQNKLLRNPDLNRFSPKCRANSYLDMPSLMPVYFDIKKFILNGISEDIEDLQAAADALKAAKEEARLEPKLKRWLEAGFSREEAIKAVTLEEDLQRQAAEEEEEYQKWKALEEQRAEDEKRWAKERKERDFQRQISRRYSDKKYWDRLMR